MRRNVCTEMKSPLPSRLTEQNRNLFYPLQFRTRFGFGNWRKIGSNRRKVSGTRLYGIGIGIGTDVLTGYLYTAFASQADYEYVLNYAKQLDVVLWESSAKRCFFGSLEGHPNIRGFIERRAAGKS